MNVVLHVEFIPDALAACERCEAGGVFAVNYAEGERLPLPARACGTHLGAVARVLAYDRSA